MSPYYMPAVRPSQGAHPPLSEAINVPVPSEGGQRHLPRLSRLEAHRGAGRNVEPHAARLRAVELERRLGLEEMIVRADLDRPVARIRNRDFHAAAAGVERDLAVLGDDFAGDHGVPFTPDPSPLVGEGGERSEPGEGWLASLHAVKEP